MPFGLAALLTGPPLLTVKRRYATDEGQPAVAVCLPRLHRDHSPQGARRVQARIQAIIELLLLYAGIGTRAADPTIRRKTALPYP